MQSSQAQLIDFNNELDPNTKGFLERFLSSKKNKSFYNVDTYEFEGKKFQFKQNLIFYQNKENRAFYAIGGGKSLGVGGSGDVEEAIGKLIYDTKTHTLEIIKPSHRKENFLIKTMSINYDFYELHSNQTVFDEIDKVAHGKYPVLIKDRAGIIKIYARKNNEWQLQDLDEKKFRGIIFPEISRKGKEIKLGETSYSLSAKEHGEIWEEVSKHHTRRVKVIKNLVTIQDEDKLKVSYEADIGKKFSPKTKTAALSARGKSAHIIQDKISGQTIKSLAKAKSKIPFETKLDISIKMIEALINYHKRGFLHRDIKPENIIADMDSYGITKVTILDHGSAIETHKIPQDAPFTNYTPTYAAPEITLDKREKIDHKADLYSLGLSLWDFLTNEESLRARPEPNLKDLDYFKIVKTKYNSARMPEVKLSSDYFPEPFNKTMSIMLAGLTHPHPDARISLEDALVAVKFIKANLEKGVLKNFESYLGDKAKNNPFAAGLKSFEALNPLQQLNCYQEIFKTIEQNSNNTYSKTNSEWFPYSDIQLVHMRAVKEAYKNCLRTLDLKNMPLTELIKLKDQLESYQIAVNEKDITHTNLDFIGRLINKTTSSFDVTEIMLNNINDVLLNRKKELLASTMLQANKNSVLFGEPSAVQRVSPFKKGEDVELDALSEEIDEEFNDDLKPKKPTKKI